MKCSSHKQIRNNFKYVIFLSLTLILREIVSELIKLYCGEIPKVLFVFLRYVGELFFGLIYYLSNIKTLVPDKKPKFIGIPLIIGVVNEKSNNSKIIFYTICIAFLDFIYFLALKDILPTKFGENFNTFYLEIRIKPMQIIFASIICYFSSQKSNLFTS